LAPDWNGDLEKHDPVAVWYRKHMGCHCILYLGVDIDKQILIPKTILRGIFLTSLFQVYQVPAKIKGKPCYPVECA
jgi:hypothetical protein